MLLIQRCLKMDKDSNKSLSSIFEFSIDDLMLIKL